MAAFVAGSSSYVFAGPTGLNVIPTTDLVPLNSWLFGFQNANTSFTGVPFYRQPLLTGQTQFGLANWLEAGLDYAQAPDLAHNSVLFNAKALLLTEDERQPNVAAGIWNVTQGQKPGYYLTLSKTLNFAQEQEERFKAHHRRNRKLLGRRVHLGTMLDGHGTFQPFAGTDLQLSESLVFQADWVHGPGNAGTVGVAYVFPDQRTVINPAILFTNNTRQFGFSLNFSHQFNF
jgi:hypothetical protein